jgi:hypothetical protein
MGGIASAKRGSIHAKRLVISAPPKMNSLSLVRDDGRLRVKKKVQAQLLSAEIAKN